MNKNLIAVFIIVALMLGACSFGTVSPNVVVGSGKVASETRSVIGFTAVELQGSANVEITIGASESVRVEADDNILPLVQTVVQNGRLVIDNKSNINITTVHPIRVTVTMKSLQAVSLKGSGNITASGMTGDSLAVDLLGSGTITINGTANIVQINLPGSGNIYCKGLQAKSVKVSLNGSGNIEVYASQSLDASILGSGSIRYGGNPSRVNKSVNGSGSITP